MKIFTREYVETLAYTSISAFAVGNLAKDLALKCNSRILGTIVVTGIAAGYTLLSNRIIGMLVDYDTAIHSIEDETFTVNQ